MSSDWYLKQIVYELKDISKELHELNKIKRAWLKAKYNAENLKVDEPLKEDDDGK